MYKYTYHIVETNIPYLRDPPMAKEGEAWEWRMSFPDGMSKLFVSECMPQAPGLVVGLSLRCWGLMQTGWRYGMSEPQKVIHCFKVGMALCLVSLFYYVSPLYEGVGGNAMWAVLTVVVAFEYTVGATICKCLNRTTATFLAGALGIGVHWVATRFGATSEPIILQASVFVIASAATFLRFLPSVKAHFDHGALIFIFTFILVSISGYRVPDLFEFTHHRVSTVAIGTSICVVTSIFCCPVWAGNELHSLIQSNMEKLADSLDGIVAEYLGDDADADDAKKEASNEKLVGYRCVLDSMSTEESLVNYARWEPAHGGFNFRHPWKDYLELGALLRSYAHCIDALSGIVSDTKAPAFLKQHFSTVCVKLSSNSTAVLRELVAVVRTSAESPKIDLRLEEMCSAVQELQDALKALSNQETGATEMKPQEFSEGGKGESNVVPFVAVVQLVTLSSLLIEIVARTEKIVKAVNTLAHKATSSE
ncbi:aluminum-activated malate transporter 10-like [Salvia miltiorrhiza]|uniref:aluminum-activated malate transporter 10-like n=1 Tax=Salvia miltiorrhiza TaxID=226208 RepID=UPI0025AD58B4|nr:aluminum-activated malate transporter 10-like [Salvia miltiorrhiza]